MDSYDVASAWQEIFQTIVQLRKRNIASTLNTLSSSSNITHNTIHRNRVFQYGSDCSLSFCVTGDAHVTFVHCTFIGQKSASNFFLLGQHNSHIEFKSCKFISCSNFCQLNNSCKATFLNCEFENCLDSFVETQSLSDVIVILRGCTWKVTDSNCTDDASESIAFRANGDEPIVFDECHFEQSVPLSEHFELVRTEEYADIFYRGCNFSNITFPIHATAMISCTFENCHCSLVTKGKQWSPLPTLIENCTFSKCSTCICANFHTEINQCLFSECSGQLIRSSHPLGGVRIIDCGFVRCTSRSTDPDSLIAIDRRCVSTSKINKIAGCYFEDCYYANGQLIGDLNETSKGYVGIIVDCKFVRCNHAESRIIDGIVQIENFCGSFPVAASSIIHVSTINS